MMLIGPNSLGFANIAENRAMTTVTPSRMPLIPGNVALLSQSGQIIGEMFGFGLTHGVGFSFLAALGNEAQIGIAEIIDYLAEDPNTKSIAIFAESVRKTEAFTAAAAKALRAGKAIVVLKVGKSQLSAAVAAAHTGSLVGDDKVFDSACESLGVIRVSSIEELILTAGLIAQVGPLKKPGICVVSISGGVCGMVADLAQMHGVSLPPFTAETTAKLREVAVDYGATMNPLDITGAVVRDPSLWEKEIAIIGRDPQIGLVLAQTGMPEAPRPNMRLGAAESIGRGFQSIPVPGLMMLGYVRQVTDYMREVAQDTGIPGFALGTELSMRVLGHLTRWSQAVKNAPREDRKGPAIPSPAKDKRPRSEREALEYLRTHNVPVVPAVIARNAAEAAAAASQVGYPVVLKINSPDIQHKTEVGGVRLKLENAAAVTAAYDEMMSRVKQAAPKARLDGAIVSPMRSGGVELIVGTARDPQWGPVVVVGLGGVWVEVLKDTAISLLPVTHDQALKMLRSLRAAKLFDGFRGSPPVNLDAVAEAVVRIGNAALSLGSDLDHLEVNPLLATADRVEALDALPVWAGEGGH
jgi:acyl-CoA synthetase (NDP forming)